VLHSAPVVQAAPVMHDPLPWVAPAPKYVKIAAPAYEKVISPLTSVQTSSSSVSTSITTGTKLRNSEREREKESNWRFRGKPNEKLS